MRLAITHPEHWDEFFEVGAEMEEHPERFCSYGSGRNYGRKSPVLGDKTGKLCNGDRESLELHCQKCEDYREL